VEKENICPSLSIGISIFLPVIFSISSSVDSMFSLKTSGVRSQCDLLHHPAINGEGFLQGESSICLSCSVAIVGQYIFFGKECLYYKNISFCFFVVDCRIVYMLTCTRYFVKCVRNGVLGTKVKRIMSLAIAPRGCEKIKFFNLRPGRMGGFPKL
jgi:hypothetical protein